MMCLSDFSPVASKTSMPVMLLNEDIVPESGIAVLSLCPSNHHIHFCLNFDICLLVPQNFFEFFQSLFYTEKLFLSDSVSLLGAFGMKGDY